MLDLLYLLSLVSLRAEDFVRNSEEFPTTSAPNTSSSIPSRGPVPNASQAGWHPQHRYCPNQYVHAVNPSEESTLTDFAVYQFLAPETGSSAATPPPANLQNPA